MFYSGKMWNYLQILFIIIGKIGGKNSNFHCYVCFGSLIQINTIICWLLDPEKGRKEV
jgi:hypothetical protein